MTAERGFQEPCERKWLLNALRGTRGQERRGEAGEVSRWRSVRAGRREGAGAEDMKPQRPSELGSEAVRPRVRSRWRRAGKEAGYPAAGAQGEKPRWPAPAPPGPVTDWSPAGSELKRWSPGGSPPPCAASRAGPADAPAASAGPRLDDGGQQHEQWVLQLGGGTRGLLLHRQDHLLQECAEQTSFEGNLTLI